MTYTFNIRVTKGQSWQLSGYQVHMLTDLKRGESKSTRFFSCQEKLTSLSLERRGIVEISSTGDLGLTKLGLRIVDSDDFKKT